MCEGTGRPGGGPLLRDMRRLAGPTVVVASIALLLE